MKRKISIAIDEDLLSWIEDQVQKKRFASVSHAVNFAVNDLIKKEEK
jgi:Arc/MetJ-type ribon-helix-helix transcriptional regulator